jgi:hypothetical protein
VRTAKTSVLLLTTLLAGIGGAAGATGAAQASARAEPTVTVLPFTQPADVVSAGDRVFVSGGRTSTQVVVTDAAGGITGTLDGLAGPTDLQLSNDRKTLYVAEPSADSVVAFDTGSLVRSATYSTGAGTCPSTLAFTGRFVWFGYGCGTWGGDIGRIDLGRHPAVVTTALTGMDVYGAPVLASALRNTKVLLAGEAGLSPWTGWAFTIGSGGTLTLASTTDRISTGSNLGDLAVDPSGTTGYSANGAPYRVQSFTVADLTKEGQSYETGAYPNSVDVSRDGTLIAGGVFAWYDPDVFVFRSDGTVVTQFELGGQDHVLTASGLAWSPNGRRLYALSNDGYLFQNPAQLHVLPVPAA